MILIIGFFFSLFAIVFVVLNYFLKQTNWYKNQYIDTYKFLKLNSKFDIVNLGSNQPKFAFDYKYIKNDKGMNWAVGPQTLEYDFRILQQYHSFLNKDAVVLIPICPFSIFLYEYPNSSANYKYYNFLNKNFIREYSLFTKLFHTTFPLLTAKRNIRRILKDVPYDRRLELLCNPMDKNKIHKDALYWIEGWKKQFHLKDITNINLSDENERSIIKNIEILKSIINYCVEKNLKPICILLPLTAELGNEIPKSFVDTYILGCINKANDAKIPVLNYLRDARFQNSDLYINSFFLNITGREKFTEVVMDDIRSIKSNDRN